MITNEEHIANQSIETITEPDILLTSSTFKQSFHLALAIHLRFHLIALVIQAVEIFLLHFVSTLMEHAVQNPVGNERTGESILLEIKTIRTNLICRHSQRRSKLTQQSVNRIYRNLPDTEETEYMVDTISIKVQRHVLEAANPPLATILQHFMPVVSRESPVLAICREIIRWSTRLSIEIEVLRLHPHITAIAVYTDRNITLQNNTLCLSMLVSRLHLCI